MNPKFNEDQESVQAEGTEEIQAELEAPSASAAQSVGGTGSIKVTG